MLFFFWLELLVDKKLRYKNFHRYFDYNCKTLLNFLNIVKNHKIKKIIFTSTEHVYGDNHFEKKISKIWNLIQKIIMELQN